MTLVSLPLASQQWPMFRVYVRKVINGVRPPWQLLPSYGRGMTWRLDGFHVMHVGRHVIPMVGDMVFRLRYGVIDGILTNSNPPDYKDFEVRCQVAQPTAADLAANWNSSSQNLNLTWYDCFHGWCEFQEDRMAPGATELLGERFYHCLDDHHHSSKWPMNRHYAYVDGTSYDKCIGHPGYNAPSPAGDGVVLGNRYTGAERGEPNGDLATNNKEACHRFTFAGNGYSLPFDDRQAVEHALNSYRGKGDPQFVMNGTTTLFSLTKSYWAVTSDYTVSDLVEDICRRQRGRGVCFYDWTDTPTTGQGVPPELVHWLRVRPQTKADVPYTVPGGSSGSFHGADTDGTSIAVDLQGDHRNIADHFFLGDRNEHRVGYVESIAERIQVLGTWGYPGNNLERRWSDADQTALVGNTVDKRRDAKWDHVYQLHGLKMAWRGTADDGNDASTRIDYRCDEDGTILTSVGDVDTSPLTVRFLTTLPLYEGYKYDGATPVPRDGSLSKVTPTRRQPMVLIRSEADKYYDVKQDLGMVVCMHGIEFLLKDPTDDGTRVVGNTGAGNETLLSQFKYDQVVLVGCMELPHRLRMGTGDKTATRKLQIKHRGLHLWLAHPKAIYDVAGTVHNSDGTYGVYRGACPSATGPGLLRDDRDALAKLHALAVSWYGPNSETRRTARWSLRACGLVPSFVNDPSGDGSGTVDVNYPKLGQLVTKLGAAGQQWDVNSPITSVIYDNVDGVTTWVADWGNRDVEDG